MPEGHTIHRLAREHRKALIGRTVAVDSPQGRFAEGAAALDGRAVASIAPHGKHLFYRWAAQGGRERQILHVHLGLFGMFRTHPRGTEPAPTAGTRLRMATDEVVIHLAGATAVELLEAEEEAAIRARLGPDPLHRGADPERAWATLRRRRIPIGQALMDQAIIAGVGNVFRAEALFVCGIDPDVPANALSRERFDCLWTTLTRMLRAGVRAGRIITVDPAEVGARSAARVPAAERTYVYRRTGLPCRRCGTAITMREVASRRLYACPGCQRGR